MDVSQILMHAPSKRGRIIQNAMGTRYEFKIPREQGIIPEVTMMDESGRLYRAFES